MRGGCINTVNHHAEREQFNKLFTARKYAVYDFTRFGFAFIHLARGYQ